MLADLADGLVDGVMVYNIDRLTRRPVELEQFLRCGRRRQGAARPVRHR